MRLGIGALRTAQRLGQRDTREERLDLRDRHGNRQPYRVGELLFELERLAANREQVRCAAALSTSGISS